MTNPSPDPSEAQHAKHFDDSSPSKDFQAVPVVGIGGSAGAIPALQRFFKTVPDDSGLVFVVILHLSPDHDSTLHNVIQRSTSLRVVQVVDRVEVEANNIYVIPPRKWLQVAGGVLYTEDITSDRGRHVAIDLFFRSLADALGPRSAAILLSGADSDGTIGVRRIKERGGLTIAQDPQEAEQTDMPQSSIATGMIDWVLPVVDMVPRLLAYFRLENELKLPAEEPPQAQGTRDSQDEQEIALREVLNFLRVHTGRDFNCYKRATILRRIARRMQVYGIADLTSYLDCLRTRQGEAGALLQDLLISVTNFFRDSAAFSTLESQIPLLFAGKRHNNPVRVWVAACATGEEAYSVAMLLIEHARTLDAPPPLQVFATDLDEQAVQMGREGLYPATIEADVSEERLKRFFTREHHGYRVSRELRKMVLFAHHDVLRDSPFSRLDLVTCRNFLIYLKPEAQERVFDTFHFALLPGGRLFLGSSESVDEGGELFSVLDKKHRLYAQRPGPRGIKSIPSGPGTLALALNANPGAQHGHAPSGARWIQPTLQPARLPPGLEGRHPSWGELHLRLLEELAPPSVLVDPEYDIVHVSPRAGQFLQYSGGVPSRNLLRMAHPGLRIELRAALYQATQNSQPAVVPPIPVELGGKAALVGICVMPASDLGEGMFLVVFESVEFDVNKAKGLPGESPAENDPLAHQLERELDRLKSHLRETVEQYESSTEELKASNEELQAMNEELRSATEELETSREELQSINEELSTVNHELKSKVDELGQANSDMHNLMDATAIATVFLDRDLRIKRFTPSAIELFNLIPTDVGRPLTDLTSHLHYDQLDEDARQVLERLAPIEREVGQADGTWYLARLRPYRTIDDRIAGVVLTFVNITERKRAEEVRLWLSAVVTASSDAIISFSLDKTILSWNGGAERLFGLTARETIGQPLSLLALKEIDDDHFTALRSGKSIENCEAVMVRNDSRPIHVAITVSPIRDDAGEVMAGTAMVRDISSSREAAEALRSSEELMRMVIENATEYAIFSTDLQRHITVWNSGAERLLGYTEREVLGRSADIIFVPEDRASVPDQEASTALAEGRSADDRFHLRKDGSRFWASGSLMLMRNASGEAAGFVKILRNQTAAREVQEALRSSREESLSALATSEQARRDLEAADMAKDRFLAVLSHELRNPLASISSAADLLRLPTSSQRDRRTASEVIVRQSHAMRTLLDDLLDISRLRMGRLEIQRRPVGLVGVTLGAIETTRPLADAAGHRLSIHLPSHEIEVHGDPLRLGQVVMNLLTNAIKYTPSNGQISISLELAGEDVVLAVTDNGIGLKPEHIEHIFGMFTQVEEVGKLARGGLGIGLALVSDIVRLHEGRVEATSPGPGQGSTFRVFLQVLRTVKSRPSVEAAPGLEWPHALPAVAPKGEQVRVLVVDDNQDMAWSLAKLLELTGYAVQVATTGEKALSITEDWSPSVVLLDIGLPDVDGREVAGLLRARPDGDRLILIAATGWGQDSDVRKSIETGFDAHLTKPVHIQQLLEMLQEQMDRRGQ